MLTYFYTSILNGNKTWVRIRPFISPLSNDFWFFLLCTFSLRHFLSSITLPTNLSSSSSLHDPALLLRPQSHHLLFHLFATSFVSFMSPNSLLLSVVHKRKMKNHTKSNQIIVNKSEIGSAVVSVTPPHMLCATEGDEQQNKFVSAFRYDF